MTSLVLSFLVFRGGDLGTLSSALAGWSRRPVVALVQAERARPFSDGPTPEQIAEIKKEYPKLKFDPEGPEWKPLPDLKPFLIELNKVGDGKDLARLLKVKTGVESQAKDGGVALWDAAWQPTSTRIEMGRILLPDGWSEAQAGLTLANDRLTARLLPRQAVKVASLAELGWSKPVKAHWLLGQMWVLPCMKEATEREALAMVAAAVGGKLVDEKEAWRIDLDPQAFRLRAQAAIDRLEASEMEKARVLDRQGKVTPLDVEVSRAGFAMSRAVWDAVDDATILDLFSAQFRGVYRKVKRGTPLYTALTRYVAASQAWSQNPPKGKEGVATMERKLFDLVDWSGEPGVFVGQNLGTSAGCARVGGGTVMIN